MARLSKNSSNSSKPPSSDITKPKAKSHGQSQNKIGAQPGHPQHERALFPEGDIKTFHDYRLSACPECDNPAVTFLDLPPRVIQQMELETFVITKEEHRSYPVWCERCGQIHYQAFPSQVVKEGLFKERLTALVAYMKAVDHASFSTIRKFIRDVLGEKVSRGYLRKVLAKVSEQAVRFVVIDRHITQGTRSLKGRETNERLWTVVGACTLQGRSAFEFILQTVRAYFRDRPAPSLLPGFT